MPMHFKDIHRFEAQNPGLAINVLSYNDSNFTNYVSDDDNAGLKHPHIDLVHRTKVVGVEPIYLLLLEKDKKFHYTAVRNLKRLLNLDNPNISSIRIQSLWCVHCLCGFRSAFVLEKHKALCANNLLSTTLFTMPENKYLAFKDWSKTVTPPFVIYADFEAILPNHSNFYQIHKPIAAGCVLINNFNQSSEYHQFVGEDCVILFLKYVESVINDKLIPFIKNEMTTPINMSTVINFQNEKQCYLCKHINMNLVKDHCHYTGNYLGAACNTCNLSRKIRKDLPILFHNLRGYDMHHILKYGISHFPKWEIACIPNTREKFTSLFANTLGVRMRFIDSLAFVSSSLKAAVANLTQTPITDVLMGNSNIVSSKGIFPYDLATSMEVLTTTTSLPPIWAGVTASDYLIAQQCWSEAGCETLLDYMLVYLKLDVGLLADVFHQFREKSITHNRLEPLNFFGIPGLSWASALMTLKEPLELLQDITMYDFF